MSSAITVYIYSLQLQNVIQHSNIHESEVLGLLLMQYCQSLQLIPAIILAKLVFWPSSETMILRRNFYNDGVIDW